MGAWVRLFKKGCPRYVNPHPFDANLSYDSEKPDAVQTQLNIFLKSIRDRDLVRRLIGELKLYRTIPVDKLAQRIDDLGVSRRKSENVNEDINDDKDLKNQASSDFNMQLLRLKLKTRQLKRTQGVMASGSWHTDPDADFFIEKGTVTINKEVALSSHREHYF